MLFIKEAEKLAETIKTLKKGESDYEPMMSIGRTTISALNKFKEANLIKDDSADAVIAELEELTK